MTKQTISERITQRMNALNLKGKHLAIATGASKGSVSQWINGGGTPSARYISSLAKILKVSENWLLNGGVLNISEYSDLTLPPVKRVPLLSLQQAASWSDYMTNTSGLSCVQLAGETSVNTFAVVLESDSMSAAGGSVSIPNGSTVFVDPDRTAQHGNIVLALPKGTTTPVIRKLEIEGPDILLVPSNPRYPSIMLDDISRILGVCFKIQQDI
nr:LexA family transcriptional regulator [Escherichia coli]